MTAMRASSDGRAELELAEHGACHLPGAAQSMLGALDRLAARLTTARAGHRIEGNAIVRALTKRGTLVHGLAADQIGLDAQAVRCILFDKSDDTNWALSWHQDRTIAVAERHDVLDFGPWTVKTGIHHVAPPFALLESMITMRIHLDPVPADNAPLLIALCSHRFGLVQERDVASTVAQCSTHPCLAERGDIWLYSTPILHASERSAPGKHRRVLQIDFSAEKLPPPLAWRGV